MKTNKLQQKGRRTDNLARCRKGNARVADVRSFVDDEAVDSSGGDASDSEVTG